jgi:hypothetical protein
MKTKYYKLGQKPTIEELKAMPGPFNLSRKGLCCVMTGELRPVKQGEWYLTGAPPHGFRTSFDLHNAYHIVKLVRAPAAPKPKSTDHIRKQLSLNTARMTPWDTNCALCEIAHIVCTDCGNLPNGFGPEELGNQRDSCVSTVEAIEAILDRYGLNIRGTGK